MSLAVLCDSCGKPVTSEEAITLDVTGPRKKNGAHSGWSDVGICRSCWSRPLLDVLNAGCSGLRLTKTRKERK